MIAPALHWAAMYISQIWYGGYEDSYSRPRFRLFCRAKSMVLYDRIVTGRVKVEME